MALFLVWCSTQPQATDLKIDALPDNPSFNTEGPGAIPTSLPSVLSQSHVAADSDASVPGKSSGTAARAVKEASSDDQDGVVAFVSDPAVAHEVADVTQTDDAHAPMKIDDGTAAPQDQPASAPGDAPAKLVDVTGQSAPADQPAQPTGVPGPSQSGGVSPAILLDRAAGKQKPKPDANCKKLTRWLKRNGYTDVNCKRKRLLKYKYPLHTAVKNNDVEMVQILLQFGSYPAHTNSSGLTPKELAMRSDKDGAYAAIIAALP